ncbi:MAG: HAD-IC family P-type ATPase, partial [Pseudomonadota bacterium]
ATGDDTLLGEIARMIDAAERGRTRHDRIADRAARIYAPAVHALAAIAFVSWYWTSGDAWTAIQIATAVLIVTCPCALALAIPTVHTVTSGRLFRDGIFLKDGAELERLAEIDMVVFDKTGTLTDGQPRLASAPAADDPAWPFAAALARASRHPLSMAIEKEAVRLGIRPTHTHDLTEVSGLGMEGQFADAHVRLGRPEWTGGSGQVSLRGPNIDASFAFAETLRPSAAETCDRLRSMGLDLVILSGDASPAVSRAAAETGITEWQAGLMPGDKLAWLEAHRQSGRKILMVGDGLNDGPALACAHASMSPCTAADVAKTAAGLVFTGTALSPVASAVTAARCARRRGHQSFGIAIAYNAVAIPLAMAGLVTPLFAAGAMSASSILVVLNALRKGRAA